MNFLWVILCRYWCWYMRCPPDFRMCFGSNLAVFVIAR